MRDSWSSIFGGSVCVGLVLAITVAGGCSADGGLTVASNGGPTTGPAPKLTFAEGKFTYLFDGNSLAGWKVPELIGGGKVWVKDKQLHVGVGDGISAVTWTGPILREDYELSLEAKRVKGEDFFCGLTFPIGKDAATLILGGWGGELVGISCINNYDASENETSDTRKFKMDHWYEVRVTVTAKKLVCHIDDEEIINIERESKRFSVRWEVEDTLPLGLSTWNTEGAIRNVCLRRLLDAEK